ncbi:methyltransferase domain-containing protein [Paenibacillus sp. GD4]|uniref:class I SAM-dependent methyltransferase n=1 Tax=Paenibacillus sp. GD4 TaxID=3068890 RepID=UPI0027969FCF|nr:class I SAM-dependent methyltransferase [Paenibacillus sp. GD4]MDQ1911630.1 methyltransferase domain-containing protein [Paenibacillus sp. GD4]
MTVERIDIQSSNDYVEILFHWHRYLIASKFVKGKVVLDLACGEGYGAFTLSKEAKRVIGVDLDETSINNAKNKYQKENLEFNMGNATNLRFADKSFDIITSFETIEHMPEEDQLRFLKEIKRVLKPDGVLFISTPDKNRTDLYQEKNPYHLKELYQAEFRDLLSKHFSQIQFYYQETNMSSVIWGMDTPRETILHNRISIEDNNITPTDLPIDIHLYMVAVCSNNEIYDSLDSVCYDIYRKPLNDLWENIDYLKHNYTKNINEIKEANLQEKENLIKKITLLEMELRLKEKKEELLTAENLLISNKYEQLEKENAELKENLQHLEQLYKINIELKEKHEFLLEDKERLKKKVSLLAEDRDNYRTMLNLLIKEKANFTQELNNLWLLINEEKAIKSNLQNELSEIYSMRTWKMIKIYRTFMDKTSIGWFFRKSRKLVLLILRGRA